MKKIIVVRLENVLVKKFNAEKSFEMMGVTVDFRGVVKTLSPKYAKLETLR